MNALQLKKQVEYAEQAQSEPPTSLPICTGEVWLGIHFPDICLVAHQAADDGPFAVLEQQQGRTRVYAMNRLAQQQGIEAGMLSSAAYALCQGLSVVARNKAKERTQLQAYAQRILSFTPRVALSEPDTLLLEVKASLRLFDGLKGLHRQLETFVTETHTIACAPVADAAELMARQGIGKVIRNVDHLRAALGEISIAGTGIQKNLVQKLARCGLCSLRDIWRLPRPDLARRFGSDLVHYLDQLSAQRNAPRRLFETPDAFKAKYDFDRETDDQRYLLYAAEILLEQASAFLQTRASQSEKVSFRLVYARHHEVTLSEFTLNVYAQQGGDRPEHFLPQLGEQLQNLALESPLNSLELRINQFRPRADSSYDLFKKAHPANHDWPVLLNLLFARLGEKRVYRLTLLADFRPEKAWQKRPAHGFLLRKQIFPYHAQRPTWLFIQPARICGADLGRRFKLISDAERLESGWWEDQDQRREYHQGVAPSGRRCWLYRDLQATGGQWYLHGLFA
jgi:protein ImuB